MKRKILFTILSLATLILNFSAYAKDIKITAIKVTYQDDKSNPGKVTTRELKNFNTNNDGIWSKPDSVDVSVELENNTSQKIRYYLISELFYKIKRIEGLKFPAIKDKSSELKAVFNDPIWIWNKTFPVAPAGILGPNEKKTVNLEKLDIKTEYNATDYYILAFAIRVFAYLPVGKDEVPKDNVIEQIFYYSM